MINQEEQANVTQSVIIHFVFNKNVKPNFNGLQSHIDYGTQVFQNGRNKWRLFHNTVGLHTAIIANSLLTLFEHPWVLLATGRAISYFTEKIKEITRRVKLFQFKFQ